MCKFWTCSAHAVKLFKNFSAGTPCLMASPIFFCISRRWLTRSSSRSIDLLPPISISSFSDANLNQQEHHFSTSASAYATTSYSCGYLPGRRVGLVWQRGLYVLRSGLRPVRGCPHRLRRRREGENPREHYCGRDGYRQPETYFPDAHTY